MAGIKEIKQRCERFLITLYLMTDKNVGEDIERETIFDTTGIDYEDQSEVVGYLTKNQWVKWAYNEFISITHKGQIEVERIMESSYSEREHKTLNAIYTIARKKTDTTVNLSDLQKALEMSNQELDSIISNLENKNFIESFDEAVFITTFGIENLQKPKQSKSTHNMSDKTDSRKVFVVHGRDWKARTALFSFLRSIGLHPIEWSEAVKSTGKGAPYIGEILDSAFSTAQAIIVLFTPDDEAKLRDELINSDDEYYEKELTPQARPNVIFEAGMAMGRNPDRTILVELGKLRPFSDVYGRHVVRINNTSKRRQELAHRLETAGCAVNLNGTDWHDEGDFSLAETDLKKKN